MVVDVPGTRLFRADAFEDKPGREQDVLRWQGIPVDVNKGDFGNPADSDTSIAACIYDDAGDLVQDFRIDQATDLCAGVPCWRPNVKGYGYNDREMSSDGVRKLAFVRNNGGSRLGLTAQNNADKGQLDLPTGVAAALAGNVSPTIRLFTIDEVCFSATMNQVRADTGLKYKAKRKE